MKTYLFSYLPALSTTFIHKEFFINYRVSKSTKPNLSFSHESVFNPEQQSGLSDSESIVSVPRLGFPHANIQVIQEKYLYWTIKLNY